MIKVLLISPSHPGDDLELKVSSLSSRMKSQPDTSSVSVVIPNGVFYADEISTRIDGYLQVYYDNILFGYTDQITSSPLYEGANGTSVQINAEGLFHAIPTVDVDLQEVTYKALNVNGDIRFRAKFDPTITPGSTVNYEGSAYLVDSITYTANNASSTMEIFINA